MKIKQDNQNIAQHLEDIVRQLYEPSFAKRISESYKHTLNQDNPLFKTVNWQGFVREEEGKVTGCVIAGIDDRIRVSGERVATLGFFESRENEGGKQLLLEAAKWVKAQGIQRITGPVNFNTWNQYRFVVESKGDPPFILEPYHKEYYPKLWEAAGFEKKWNYYSGKRIDFDTLLPYTKPAYEAALAQGFTIRAANADKLEQEMKILHRLTTEIFKDNVGFVPLTFEEYSYIYSPLTEITDPRLSHIIEKEGEPIGYSYSLADKLDSSNRRVILKTIGLLPNWQGKHLGAALAYTQHNEMQRQGFQEIVYALIAEGNAVGKMKYPGASIFRRYALYELNI